MILDLFLSLFDQNRIKKTIYTKNKIIFKLKGKLSEIIVIWIINFKKLGIIAFKTYF